MSRGLSTLLLLLPALNVVALQRHVPQEYGTIQAALSSAQSGDTVVVSPGIYEESLAAPETEFTLMGSERLDSSSVEMTIIDPTALPGSDSLRILTMRGGNGHFQDIVFRNRAGMTADRLASNPAGIVGDTATHRVTFLRCVFDSVLASISKLPRIEIDSSRFIGSRGLAISTARPGKLYASATWFDGATGSQLSIRRGGHVKDCLFTHFGEGYMLLGLGDSLVVEDCRFVGQDTLGTRALWLRPRCSSSMRDCLFENLVVRFNAVVDILDSCYEQEKDHRCAFRMTNNRFVNCRSSDSTSQQGGEMVELTCADGDEGYIALFDSNIVESAPYCRGEASGFFLHASCVLRNNSFGDTLDSDRPQVYIECGAGSDTVILRDNMFDRDYFGVARLPNPLTRVDARENWWGSASGPFHPEFNPNATGAEVDDNILFAPWLLFPPDSSDTNEVSARDWSIPMAEDFHLSAHPNPFNASTRLMVEVSRAGTYEVMLYDVTGRSVSRLFAGRIDLSREIAVNSSDLPSGVYFALLRNEISALVVTKLLLIK